MGDKAKARERFNDYLGRRRERVGATSENYAHALFEVGKALLKGGDPATAREMLALALKIHTGSNPKPWCVFSIESALGASLIETGDPVAAEAHLVKAYEGLKREEHNASPSGRSLIDESLERLIRAHQATGNKSEEARRQAELKSRRTPAGQHERPKDSGC